MARKRVLITLPVDAYRRLAEMAEDEERVIDQQASLLLKRLLISTIPSADGATVYGDPPSEAVFGGKGGLS
jgi:hypothetical protein